MMDYDWEFVIPLKREDLFSTQSPNQFYVSDIYRSEELHEKVDECKLCLKTDGCEFILQHFKTLFSVLQSIPNLNFKFINSFYNEIIIVGLNITANSLALLLDDDNQNPDLCLHATSRTVDEDELNPDLRNKMLNLTKMMIYITVEFLKSIQGKVNEAYSLIINQGRKKNTKLKKLKEDHNWDWEENQKLILSKISSIIKLPLFKLWRPAVAERDFIRMIEDCCYSVMENDSIASIRMKSTREIIFEILAVLITQYNNSIGCKVKIVQMLKHYEHLVSVLVQAVVYFVEKHNCRSLVKELIIEIIETGTETCNSGYDSSCWKSFSAFIIEIATQQPKLILPCANLLLPHLDCDPYSMRICVLSVMAEIICKILHVETQVNADQEDSDDSDAMNELESRRKYRDSYLELLLEHIRDHHFYVRVKVLKLWQEMYARNAVPKHFVIALLNEAVQRLYDKSSAVVKHAVRLIRVMLTDNLYGAVLDEEPVQQNLRGIKTELIKTEMSRQNPSLLKIWFYSQSDISGYIKNKLEEVSDDESDDACEEIARTETEKLLSDITEFVMQQNYEKLTLALFKFEKTFLNKLKILKNISDKVQYFDWILGNFCKQDDISFLQNLLNCTKIDEFKKLINEPIVFDSEDVQFGSDRSLLAYCQDYLKFIDLMRRAASIIRTLMMGHSSAEIIEAIEFFRTASQFNLTGVEEGVRNILLLINSKDPVIKEAVVNTFKILYFESEKDKRASLAVDKLIALLKKVTHEQKNALNNLIVHWINNNDIGADFTTTLWDKYWRKIPCSTVEDSKAAAVLISMCASAKPEIIKNNMESLVKFGLNTDSIKDIALLKLTCQMFRALYDCKSDTGIPIKYSMDSDFIKCLSLIAEEQFFNLNNNLYPELACEVITSIYRLSEFPDTVCGNLIKSLSRRIAEESDAQENDKIVCNEEFVVRFLVIVGHVTFCEWQYLENDVSTELKRMNAKNKANENISVNSSKISKKKARKSDISKTNHTHNEENYEDDSSAIMNERILESIRVVCENEILEGDTILAMLSNMVVKICQNLETYEGNRLKSAASISLSKIMMTSAEFCSRNIQLFVTILEKTTHPAVKINLILAFGDLTFRFPNVVEPWTFYYYNRLRDVSPNVRYTALMVIFHLITNEMVKIKGQMSDIALCIVDEEKNIRNYAIRLFMELSTKGNALYNVMPDIISRLSHPDHRPTEENFQIILKLLMKFITKDRQQESLIEKLCHRLRGAADERQSADLSYCIFLVNHTDRTVQKLLDNIACYADKLDIASVRRHFASIIINCKKQAKGTKLIDLVSELESKIDVILTKGVENLDADFMKPPKTPAKTPAKTSKISQNTNSVARKTTKIKAKKKIILDSSEESNED